jgi:hypothetical protein
VTIYAIYAALAGQKFTILKNIFVRIFQLEQYIYCNSTTNIYILTCQHLFGIVEALDDVEDHPHREHMRNLIQQKML